MPNGNHQLEYLIEEAMERVAVDGRNASQVDIMLAGFGYLAYQINRPQWWSMKKIAVGGGGGVFTIGVVGAIIKW